MKKLLIVDNSSVILNALIDLFAIKNDFEIFTSKSLKETKELLDENEFFLVISNRILPDALNGELLEIFNRKKLPTIILTSKIDDKFLEYINCFSNVIDYILKDSLSCLEDVYKLVELIDYIEGSEVLIVDDSLTIQSKIRRVLSSLLLNVHSAKSVEVALEILEANDKISLIVSDYEMPNLNGLDLTKSIRKDFSSTSLPIIIVSSIESDEIKISLFKSGANDFIKKPILDEELKRKTINVFLNTKNLDDINIFNKIIDENVIYSSTDKRGIIKSVSNGFCKISGYSKGELIGKNHNIVRHPDMPKSTYEELWGKLLSKKSWRGELKNRRKDGEYYWVNAVIEPIHTKRGEVKGYFAIREDITDKKKIYELSITDGLTSLYNRRYFSDLIDSFIKNVIDNRRVFAFLLLDIDNFKKYNDTYGHQDGDDVLIKTAKALKKSFENSNSLVFRLGGEEFGVLMDGEDIEEIKLLSESARKNIENLGILHIKNPPLEVVTASFGVYILESDEFDSEKIYKSADDLLYKAKESGRNRVVYSL